MAPTTVHDVPEHLLLRIFRLLDSHDAVLRAAAVCTRWRPIIASICGRYWRRCNRHDFVTCIGHYHAVDPSFSPDPKKPAATAQRGRVAFVPASPSIDARHFSLDFVPTGPGGRPWELVDGRGSLLLLASRRRDFFPDLVVCEPISRRCVRIQPIPDLKYSRCLGAFLGCRFNSNFVILSEFKVTCVLHDAAEGMADCVGSVTARVYNYGAPPAPPDRRPRNGWDMSRAACSRVIHLHGAESAHYAGRAMGKIFFGVEADGTVLSRESDAGVLSHFRLPEHVRESHHRSTFVLVDDGRRVYPCRLRVVSLMGDELRVFVNQGHHGGGGEWELERSLHLPEATRGLPGRKECYFSSTAKIVTAGMGYVVLTPAEETWLFSVDLRMMQVEREHSRNWFAGEVYPYELETPPMVHACVVPCKRRHGGICRGFCKCR